MEKEKKIKKLDGIFILIIMLLCSVFGIVDAGAMCADVTTIAEGGVSEHGGAGSTVEFAHDNVDDLILNTIDKEVLKLEPYKFPLDTISRNIKRIRNSNNQIIEYYTDGFLPSEVTLPAAYAGGSAQDALDFGSSFNANIAINETLICKNLKGYVKGTNTQSPVYNLQLVVVERDSSGKPIVRAVNGMGTANNIPAIPANTVMSRAGRAASEKQIRTDVYTNDPTKKNQYLQKFIAEVEESTFMEMSDKEVEWNMSDLTERALLEYRREVEKTFWLGVKDKQKIKNKYNKQAEDTYFTEGVWYQAGGDFSFGGIPPNSGTLVDLMQVAFSGPSSSDQKILLTEPDLVTSLEKVDYNQVIYPGERQQMFGFKLSSIISLHGELLVYNCKAMRDVGLQGKGLILDVNYLSKWTMGWRTIPIDNVKNGDSDSKSRILTEVCGLILKNPEAHIRVSLT